MYTIRMAEPKPKTKPVRLIDIAREAKVSPAAVGFVMNNTGQGVIGVSDETARRIRSVAQRMGYRPNRLAQSLAGKQSKIIGAIIDSGAAVKFHWLMLMEQIATARGYRFMIGQSHDNPEHVAAYAQDFLDWGVDGVICLSHDYPAFGQEIVKALDVHAHVVYVDQPMWQPEKHCYVAVDGEKGMRLAVEHLQALGRKRIGLLHHELEHPAIAQRHAGYLHAMADAKLKTTHLTQYVSPRCELAELAPAVQKLLDQHIDGLVTTYDPIGVLAVNWLHQQGVRVPEDVAVFGWDNTDMTQLAIPALSSVDVNGMAIAQSAVNLLLDLMAGKELTREQTQITIDPFLVHRGSCPSPV